ncbi:HlyD family efflux transporter periplasmic adaptor subunit [Opitutales bacterium ASA1]|uniref:efflux RND transporter periplasmic adaptor subunit n=1 Tax=Congregicoccus parvus TaxID=3081749 RepID=UPI002B2DC536|nr:HlyD family efflux transporter periplasmic adaptor subunit [Opitutales bacterium ASA1]
MDIQKPSQAGARRRKRLFVGGIVLSLVIALTVFLARLEPAAPTVDRNLVYIDTVRRGPMVRQVRGLGTLVPEEIRWIAARTAGRVDRIVLRPGAPVEPESVVLELVNPAVEQAAESARSEFDAASAELINLRIELESSLLAMEAAVAGAKSLFETSKLQAEVNDELFQDGLVSALELRRTRVAAEEAATRYEIEKKRYEFSRTSIEPRLSVKQAEVNRLQAVARLRGEEFDALRVRAGVVGVLQVLPVEVGAQVQPGTNLARVADPTRLKAEIRVAESLARDVQIGQKSVVDTRNGTVEGTVSRIDPSVQNGTVTVDVVFSGPLPRGARPDLSVDGVVELDRLADAVFVGRPAFGQEESSVGIYKLTPEGDAAVRTRVRLGRASVNTIEILEGLQPGDRVILSDMSQWDAQHRVRLR